MSKRARLLAAVLVLAGVAWFALRGGPFPGTAVRPDTPPRALPNTFRVGVLYWSSTIEGQVAMRRGLEAEAALVNRGPGPTVELVPLVAGDGVEGQRRQIDQMRDLIRQDVDAIIVQPTDNVALAAPLREANDASIPVVAYDQYIEGGELAAFVTSDNRQAGMLDGEYVAHRFPAGRTLRLVLVEYPQVSSTVERLDGFLAALTERGRSYEILKTYEAVEPIAGREAGGRILADFPERGSVDVVFTVNDGGGLAVVDVLADAGRTEIAVATIDGDPRSVANIREGRLTIIDAAQFCGPLGAAAFRAAWSVLLGEQVDRHQLVPTFPITPETLDRYPGWDGPLPEAFDKPWPSSEPRWEPRVRGAPTP
ncbi:MAG: sugar ABC transporter substrate-binding protein [Pseudomonadota bacterium]|nr:sugar ABC transporter substrate-binding protein [Pseudomonadota bacterium]